MKIKQVIETPEGNYSFEGEINEVEHDIIVQAGINWLFQQGVIPFKGFKKPEDKINYIPASGEEQPS